MVLSWSSYINRQTVSDDLYSGKVLSATFLLGMGNFFATEWLNVNNPQ